MAIVPTKYVFIKESNGNVTLETYDGSTLLGTASLNPAKDIRISESYPNSIIIPFNTTGNHIDNKFVSIPWQRIDFVGSTPSNTAPADINEAVAILGEDFFFELGGSGGGSARNGLDVVSGFVELGGDLIQDTVIDTKSNNFTIQNGTFEFVTGEIIPGTQGIQFKNNISVDEFVSVNVSDAGDSQMVYINTNLNTAFRVGVESGSASILYIPDITNPGVGIIGFTVLDNQILVSGLQNFADDVAAAAGGISLNGMYHTAGVLKIRLT